MPDATITVKLTADEARALRMAAIFGAPPRPVPSLENAVSNLRQAERRATS